MDDTDRIQEILDRQEIHNLRSGYSHAIDTQSWKEFGSLFTEDGILDYPDITLEGKEEIEAYLRNRDNLAYDSMHTALMPKIKIDGDEATGLWYLFVPYAAPDGSKGYVLGTYKDTYRRTQRGWKYEKMRVRVTQDTGGFVERKRDV